MASSDRRRPNRGGQLPACSSCRRRMPRRLVRAHLWVGRILKATGARPGPGAQSSLEYSSPSARDASGRFLGFSRFDAAELNRIQQGKELRQLRFVDRDVPSTGPDVVSVNVIDDFTWAAAALSDQTD